MKILGWLLALTMCTAAMCQKPQLYGYMWSSDMTNPVEGHYAKIADDDYTTANWGTCHLSGEYCYVMIDHKAVRFQDENGFLLNFTSPKNMGKFGGKTMWMYRFVYKQYGDFTVIEKGYRGH